MLAIRLVLAKYIFHVYGFLHVDRRAVQLTVSFQIDTRKKMNLQNFLF